MSITSLHSYVICQYHHDRHNWIFTCQQKPHLPSGLHGQVLTEPFTNLLRIKNCCPKAKIPRSMTPYSEISWNWKREALCLAYHCWPSKVPITVSSIRITISTKLSMMQNISLTVGRKKFKCYTVLHDGTPVTQNTIML